jgi:transposase-like protein
MIELTLKRHRFPAEIIRRSIWLYARFTLSFRDVEDLLAERGPDVFYETVVKAKFWISSYRAGAMRKPLKS